MNLSIKINIDECCMCLHVNKKGGTKECDEVKSEEQRSNRRLGLYIETEKIRGKKQEMESRRSNASRTCSDVGCSGCVCL